MFVTKYGSAWDGLPNTSGRKFWVSPTDGYTVNGDSYRASDGNGGLDPREALRSVNRAFDLVTADVGDVIVLLPGAHTAITANTTTAASIGADVAGVTLWGLSSGGGNPMRRRVTLSGVVADQTLNVTAADIEIANISFIGNATQTGSAFVDYSAAAGGLYVHDCLFDFTAATAGTSILGLDAIGAAPQVAVERCTFLSDGAFGAGLDLTATLDALVQDCAFLLQTGTWAAALTCGAATDRALIRRCQFIDFGGTMTIGINGTGATIANGVAIHDCRFGVTVSTPIGGFDAAEAMISENYDFGVGATDGGVLITAIA